MDHPLPDDPRVRRTDQTLIGCNRVVCPLCDAPVRHFDKLIIGNIPNEAQHAALYGAMDPLQFPFVRSDPEFRAYLCRCQTFHTPTWSTLNDSDTDWRCAGHPE